MNGDVWKDPHGRIVTEVRRRMIGRYELVAVVAHDPSRSPFDSFRVTEYPIHDLTPEPARYHGARGGRG